MQLERQKAAVLGKVRRLQGKLIQSRRQIQQLRQELNEERENGQVSLTSQEAEGRAGRRTCTVSLRKGKAKATAGRGSTEADAGKIFLNKISRTSCRKLRGR